MAPGDCCGHRLPAHGRGAQPFNLTQVTNTTGTTLSNFSPSINAIGTRIVFASDRDLTPVSPGNADGNYEIFLFDTATGLFTQITNTTRGSISTLANSSPSINATGTRIAFDSISDLTPGSPGNADGNREIFLFDTTTGSFTQITNTTSAGNPLKPNNLNPSIDGAGTRIAFFSAQDLTPGSPGNADGNFEIFLAGPADGNPPIPTLSVSMQIAVAALLLIGGLHFIRRRPA